MYVYVCVYIYIYIYIYMYSPRRDSIKLGNEGNFREE